MSVGKLVAVLNKKLGGKTMAISEIDGGYYVEVYLGRDERTGKRVRKTKTFRPRSRKTLKEAKAWEAQQIDDYEKGNFSKSDNLTVGDFIREWYSVCVENKKAYNTQKRYKVFCDCITGYFEKTKITKLTPKMVDDFYKYLQTVTVTRKNGDVEKRYMDGTILKTHRMFRSAIEQAQKWGIVKNNPVDLSTPPADDKRKAKHWSSETVDEFLEHIKEDKIYLPIVIAYHTGLREGEVCALRGKHDLFLDEGYLEVNHNLVEVTGEGLVLDDTKTPESEATVALTEALILALKHNDKEQKKHRLRTGIELEYVCGWEDGRPFRPTYISKRFTALAKEFAKEKGIDHITFHGLRHSHASILFKAGATSHEISKRLRHSRVSTTDNIYIHMQDEMKKSTADLFDKALEMKNVVKKNKGAE